MTLDVEQLGRSFTFLEVQVECVGCEIQFGLKNKVLHGHMTTQPEIKRYPHPGGEMACHTVRGMAHALALKSLRMQRSRALCGTPPILGVVNMVGTRNFTCYMGAP